MQQVNKLQALRNRKILFLFLNQNICCGYSKEPSQWDGSFEHPKHMLKIMGHKILTILRWKFLFIQTYEAGNVLNIKIEDLTHAKAGTVWQNCPCERCRVETGPLDCDSLLRPRVNLPKRSNTIMAIASVEIMSGSFWLRYTLTTCMFYRLFNYTTLKNTTEFHHVMMPKRPERPGPILSWRLIMK